MNSVHITGMFPVLKERQLQVQSHLLDVYGSLDCFRKRDQETVVLPTPSVLGVYLKGSHVIPRVWFMMIVSMDATGQTRRVVQVNRFSESDAQRMTNITGSIHIPDTTTMTELSSRVSTNNPDSFTVRKDMQLTQIPSPVSVSRREDVRKRRRFIDTLQSHLQQDIWLSTQRVSWFNKCYRSEVDSTVSLLHLLDSHSCSKSNS